MNYRDNKLIFNFNNTDNYDGSIEGSFVVKEAAITRGQDPKGKIYRGRTYAIENNALIFNVGRKGSEEVATWFNTRAPSDKNTFGHNAGKLNFAILGDLTLVIRNASWPNKRVFIFENIILAQGHSGESNNWWFGGTDCYSGGNTYVFATSHQDDKSLVTFNFQRGGSASYQAVNIITVEPQFVSTEYNWMERLNDSKMLNAIIMPGSHDAGMSETNHCNPVLLGSLFSQTQQYPIYAQLICGARYFDIRVDYDYEELVTYYRTDGFGCNGQTMKSVLDQATRFLKEYPSELVIFKFSHIRDYKDHLSELTKKRINDVLDNYSNSIYVTSNKKNENIAYTSMGALRGKMVLVFDYAEYNSQEGGRFRYKDYDSESDNFNIMVYDQYSDTSHFDIMQNDQKQKFMAHAGLNQKYLFLLSWTLTATPPITIKTLADIANSHLIKGLVDLIGSNREKMPNIVYIDYLDSSLAKAIIDYNFT